MYALLSECDSENVTSFLILKCVKKRIFIIQNFYYVHENL